MDNQGLDALLERMVADYVRHNSAASILKSLLDQAGVGLHPVIDHVTLRTLDIDQRAREYVALGYVYSETLEYNDWFAKVYRKVGYPALFVDQGYAGERGQTSNIRRWLRQCGDGIFHHVAVRGTYRNRHQHSQRQGRGLCGEHRGRSGWPTATNILTA